MDSDRLSIGSGFSGGRTSGVFYAFKGSISTCELMNESIISHGAE